MSALIILFLILNSVGVFAVAFSKKVRFEDCLFVNCSGIVIILYIFGLLGILEAGVFFILFSCLLLYAISVIRICKSIKDFSRRFFTPGFFYFTVLFVALIVLHHGRMPSYWDEFSHWADVVKAMFSINDFSTSPLSHSLFQSYVPGMTLFQYFFQKVHHFITPDAAFQEWMLYLAYHLFSCSFALPFFKEISYQKFFSGAVLFAAVCFAPTIFFSSYLTTVYIDPFVAIAAGSGFAMLYAKEKNPWLYVNLLLTLMVLVLAKDVGMMFAVFLAIAILFDKALPLLKKVGAKDIFKQRNLLILTFCVLLAVALPKIFWNLQIAQNNAIKNFSQPIDFAQIIKVWSGADQTYHTEVTARFFQRFFATKTPFSFLHLKLTYPLIFAILLLGLIAIHLLYHKTDASQEKPRRMLLLILSIQTVVYVVGLSILYLFKFTEYEAMQLASFDRYLGIAFLAMLLMFALITCSLMQQNQKYWYPLGCILVAILLFSLPVKSTLSFINRSSVSDSIAARSEYEEISSEMLAIAQNDQKNVYLVSQESDGFDYWVLRYSIRPCVVNDNFTWSLSTSGPLFEGDVWTQQKTPEQWKNELEAYDYVLLYQIDKTFRRDYADVFANIADIAERTIYSVDHETGLLSICQ